MISLIKPNFLRHNRKQDNKIHQSKQRVNVKSILSSSNLSKNGVSLSKKSHSISAATEPSHNQDYIKYLKKKQTMLPPLKEVKPKSCFLKRQPTLAIQEVIFVRKGMMNPSKNRIKTQQASKRKNITHLSRNSSCKSLKSCSGVQANYFRPTDKYISRLNNIKFVQRLLLAKPSNDVRKDSHQKFYTQQQKLKGIISRRISTSNLNKIQKSKQIKNLKQKKQWI